MLALLTWLLYTMKVAATQTVVAHWEFTTGYDVEKNGTTAIYTPNTLGWVVGTGQYEMDNIAALFLTQRVCAGAREL